MFDPSIEPRNEYYLLKDCTTFLISANEDLSSGVSLQHVSMSAFTSGNVVSTRNVGRVGSLVFVLILLTVSININKHAKRPQLQTNVARASAWTIFYYILAIR